MKKTHVITYGTLRKGHANYNGLLKGKSTYLGTYQTKPEFTMYSAGGFPIVCDHGNTAIEYDLFEIDSEQVLQSLHNLEGCTGIAKHPDNWYDIITLDTPHGSAIMYIQHDHRRIDSVVTSGNWNEVVKEREKQYKTEQNGTTY